MIPVKKALAALILAAFLILQLQPVLNSSGNFTEVAFSQAMPALNGNNGQQVSVFIPQGSPAGTALNAYLSSLGIQVSNFGSISTFYMPEQLKPKIVAELNDLNSSLGMSYYISNGTALAYPSIYSSVVASPSQQTPSEYFPNNIANAYNFTYPLKHGITGKGSTIAIIDGFGDPSIKYDVRAFDNVTGLPPVNLSIVYPNNVRPTGYNYSWAIETATDVEWAHALAPGANIVLVVAKDANVSSLDSAVSYVISHKLANIMSLSWGIPENQLGLNGVNTFSGVYQEAAQNGITVLAATGDFGAYDQQKTPTVNFPSSDPYVLAIGGTSLFVYNNQYTQKAWGGILDGSSYGGGGGYSKYYSAPWWQKAPNFGSASRGTPDVSMNANKDTGMFVISQAKDFKIGGTSIGTPIWADVVSMMDQAAGHPLGFVSPLLYQISNTPAYAKSFFDITSGNNGYYNATKGWDAATGLGTPKVSTLVNNTVAFEKSYGAMGIITGSGYNSTSIGATLKVNGTPASENLNGSTFYYLSSYYNQNNFVKVGVRFNNTTISRGIVASQDGLQYSSFSPVSTFSKGSYTFALSLSVNGAYVNYSIGAYSNSMHLFLENAGRSSLSFGAEQLNSMTNLTAIPNASFLNVTLASNSTLSSPRSVYENHFSSAGYQGYSTVQINQISGANYSVSYSKKPSDIALSTVKTGSPQIVYRLSFASKPTAYFSITNYSGSVYWGINGKPMGGTGTVNSTSFSSYGYFNISAKLLPSGPTIYRIIKVPAMIQSNITALSSISYDKNPTYTVNENNFYSFTGNGKISIPSLQGTNTMNITSKGFTTFSSNMIGGSSLTANLNANYVNVSVFVNPANATVKVNNTTANSSIGWHRIQVKPNSTFINISAPGYTGTNYTVRLMPGVDYTSQHYLAPANMSGLAEISGNVTDGFYRFPISGVNLSIGGVAKSYTNQTGYYELYLVPGKYNISFNSPLYKEKYVVLNFTGTAARNLEVSLYPKDVNTSSLPQISIGRVFPLLFYLGYLSWNAYSGQNFAYYLIYISSNPGMTNFRTVTITGQNTTFAFLTNILPGHTYYVKISVFLTDGETYSSSMVTLSYSNPLVLLANIAILGGILAYAVMAVRYIGRMRKKRVIRL